MPAAAPAHMDAEFMSQRRQTALQGTDHAGGNARGMPVHSHYGTEGLEPEWMRWPPQEFITAVVMHDRLADDGAQRGHARGEPRRHATAMQRKISAAGSACHQASLIRVVVPF